jgi:two-component system LytT family response regulator
VHGIRAARMNTAQLSTLPLPTALAPIRTLVVDDESVARRGMKLLLSHDPEIEVVGEAASVAEATELCARLRPELAFLDVQMPGGSGFDVLAALGSGLAPVVVFVTAYDEFALRAFEVSAIDYVLKPYDDARFQSAVTRAKSEVRRRKASTLDERLARLMDYVRIGENPPPAGATTDRILVKSSGEIFFLKPDEIDWIEAEGDYMKFHVGDKIHLTRETMAKLSARLDARRFIRIHRSTIVNVDRVAKIKPALAGDYTVVLQDETKLKLSRSHHQGLAAIMRK